MTGTINANGDAKVLLPAGVWTTIGRKELTTCSDNELKEAIGLASSTNDIPQVKANINSEIANIKDSKSEAAVGPIFTDGKQSGELVFLGKGMNPDGTSYASLDAGSTSAVKKKEDLLYPQYTSPLNIDKNLAKAKEDKVYEYKTSSNNKMQETLSGSDLSVFYIVELPDIEDILAGITTDYARKEVVMLEFDSVLSISYSTIREKFPVRALGYANPKAITNGIRTISGHIAFNVFAEDVLTRLRGRVSLELEKKRQNVYGEGSDVQSAMADMKDKKYNLGKDADLYKLTPLASENYKAMLLDQLPPFHLLIMGVNEHGIMSRMMIKDVSIVDENQYQGTQQPNIVNRCSFVAMDIVPMTARQYDNTVITQSLSSMEEGYVGGNWNPQMKDLSASSILTEVSTASIERNTKRDL